ncbi:MAG: prepilin-type N-terminal cleavage/methylation domain-containing protein [Candidatus Reddybacter sp.]
MTNSKKIFRVHGFSSQKGFTLLEALIAMVVLAGGLLAAYRFNSTTISYSAESNVRTYALAMAEGKLEELRNFQDSDDFDVLVVSSPEDPADDDVVAYGASTLTREWVRDDAYGNGDNPRKVDVTVSWPDKGGVTQSVVLSSVIWRNNPESNAKELFLALNTDGKGVDGYGDSDGHVPLGRGGGKVIVSETYTDEDGDGEPDGEYNSESERNFYDVTFEGSILFTDQGLEAISITMTLGEERISWCEVTPGELFYVCYIKGIPDGTDWGGILDFDPAGNNFVCEPSTQEITIELINQATTELSGLEVVVMKNRGTCP